MRAIAVAAGLSIALLAPAATLLQGQTVPAKAADSFCWRGEAMPACRSFALFEMEGGLAVASTKLVYESSAGTTEHPAFENELTWHLGAMRNLTEEWALGATLSLGAGSPNPLKGIRVRARRWLDPPMSAELEAGAVATGVEDRIGSYHNPVSPWKYGWGPTVGARLNMDDHLSVFTRWEGAYAQAGSDAAFQREAGFHHGLYVGASAGSTVGVAGSAAVGAIALWLGYASLR